MKELNNKNWYLAQTTVVKNGDDSSIQVSDSSGNRIIICGMEVLISRTESAQTECIVGIPANIPAPKSWKLLSLQECESEYNRLFGELRKFEV